MYVEIGISRTAERYKTKFAHFIAWYVFWTTLYKLGQMVLEWFVDLDAQFKLCIDLEHSIQINKIKINK